MINLDVTLAFQLVNFLIALYFLNILIIRPIREALRKRADVMAGLLSEAENFSSQAETQLKGYEAALEQARARAAQERDALRQEGVDEEKRLVSQAGAEAQQELDSARRDLAGQVAAAGETLQGRVADLAALAADKVLC